MVRLSLPVDRRQVAKGWEALVAGKGSLNKSVPQPKKAKAPKAKAAKVKMPKSKFGFGFKEAM